MKILNIVWVSLTCLWLIACSQGDGGKGISVADLQGHYKFELKQDTGQTRAELGSGFKGTNFKNTGVQHKEILFTLGPNYIAFGDDKQPLDQMSVQEVGDEKLLVLKVADKEMNLKIIDKETLFLKQGSALGIFTRVK